LAEVSGGEERYHYVFDFFGKGMAADGLTRYGDSFLQWAGDSHKAKIAFWGGTGTTGIPELSQKKSAEEEGGTSSAKGTWLRRERDVQRRLAFEIRVTGRKEYGKVKFCGGGQEPIRKRKAKRKAFKRRIRKGEMK